MTYTIRIKRQKDQKSKPYWQEFVYDGNQDASVAAILNDLNSRSPLLDTLGQKSEPIAWECGCMVRKCGACAMRINGIPRLACSTFLKTLKGHVIILEPLSKFPLVKDLIVDRSVIFKKLKEIQLWLESEAYMMTYTHESRYQSARCLMCGCCLEICPNFIVDGNFGGAIVPVNAYRILNEEKDRMHQKEIIDQYRKKYFEGCGKSLSCHNICPAKIPVDDLIVRSNAVSIWKR